MFVVIRYSIIIPSLIDISQCITLYPYNTIPSLLDISQCITLYTYNTIPSLLDISQCSIIIITSLLDIINAV